MRSSVHDLSRMALCTLAASWLCACIRLDRTDSFPVGTPPTTLARLQELAGSGSQVSLLPAQGAGRPVLAYYVSHAGARGVVLLLGGSGNEVEAPIKVMAGRTRELGLDLAVFSYYRRGEAVPSVADVRGEARAVYGAIQAAYPVQAGAIYLAGYSLGGWFALDLAASQPSAGLLLVGAETTPAEVIRKTNEPWSALLSIDADEDERQLDAALYAPSVKVRTMVVTSLQDEDVPARIGYDLLALLPTSTPKQLVVLHGVSHGRYFLSPALWTAFAGFVR